MKSIKKHYLISLIIILSLISIACTNKNSENSFRDFFPDDKAITIESKTIFPSIKDSETISFTTSVLHTEDNKIQYVTKGNTISTYIYEFRDNSIYSYVDTTAYKSLDDIPNLLETIDSSKITNLVLQGPLEIGTTWESPNSSVISKIDALDSETFTVVVSNKIDPNSLNSILVYRKNYGLFSSKIYTNGELISSLDSTILSNEN